MQKRIVLGLLLLASAYVTACATESQMQTSTDVQTSEREQTLTLNGASPLDVVTERYDLMRHGAQLGETALSPNTVNQSTFGKLYSFPVAANMFGQPLYVANLTMGDGTVHNVLYVFDEQNDVYAYDADNRNGTTPLWQVNLGPYVPQAASGMQTGILSTPVINRSTNTMYVVAEDYENGVFQFTLHALDIATGAEKLNGPAVIDASVPGVAPDAVNGAVSLSANNQNQLQRPGLLEVNGHIYIGFGSQGDRVNYHGWLLSYDETTLQQTGAFVSTPQSVGGGVWMSGHAPAADANNDVYIVTANSFSTNYAYNGSLPESMLKLHQNGNSLKVADSFTIANHVYEDNGDLGFGSTSVTLIDTGVGVDAMAGTKDGYLYNLNASALGGISTGDTNALQVINTSATANPNIVYTNPLYWNSSAGPRLFTWPQNQPLVSYAMNGRLVNTTALAQSTVIDSLATRGAQIALSANGNQIGSGILWGYINKGGNVGQLLAFNANNVAQQLYDSSVNPNDAVGAYVKFASPMVANGRVFVPTSGNVVQVYGLHTAQGGSNTVVAPSSTHDVLTQHNNNAREGLMPGETALSPNTVDTSHFGKLFTLPIDGGVTAQPLYVNGQVMADGSTHNVVYIATAHEHLYAFDADTGTQLWLTTMGPYVPSSYYGAEVGIMGTPVVNRATNAIYFVTLNEKNNTFLFTLHALDLGTGQEKFDGPVPIAAQAPGTAGDSTGGQVVFNAAENYQRPALLDSNGNIYIAFGSHNQTNPYHGWVMAYSDTTLAQVGVYLETPQNYGGDIWMSGQGPAADANGDILVTSGARGESLIKLHQNGNTLAPSDYFQPYNAAALDANNLEFGLGGVTLVPGSAGQQALVCGKDGNLYNVSDASLGGISASNANATQVFNFTTTTDWNYGNPVFLNSTNGQYIYAWPLGTHMMAFSLNGSKLSTTPVMTTHLTISGDTAASGMLSVSSNGAQAQTGIVWAVFNKGSYQGELHAYNAENLTQELWNSSMNANDAVGSFARYTVPTVANGKVYVPNSANGVSVYGLK